MKKNCAACHEEYKGKSLIPFCSQLCEISFHEHAPASLIHKVYKEYKENECQKDAQPCSAQHGAL